MGLMDKLKNIFTEEVEEEVKPIKKEVIQVPIAAPKPEETEEKQQEEEVTDSAVLKEKDEKFVFPVFFDDEDFTKLDNTKPKHEAKPNKDYGSKIEKEEVKKVFKPTPIISPVYGVLDKNYHKEDITTKSTKTEYVPKKGITIDDIRNKAFGTLEDDLENTLYGKNSIFFDEEETEIENDLFEELENNSEEYGHNSVDDFLNKDLLERNIEILEDTEPLTRTRKYRIKEELAIINEKQAKIEEANDDIIEDDIHEDITNDIEEDQVDMVEDNIVKEEIEKDYEEQDEIEKEYDEEENNDLFDLVDSMYDEKEDE